MRSKHCVHIDGGPWTQLAVKTYDRDVADRVAARLLADGYKIVRTETEMKSFRYNTALPL